MTIENHILPDLILTGFNLVNAYIDAYKIKGLHREIKHGINLGAYLATFAAVYYMAGLGVWEGVVFLIYALANRQFSFDIPLNLRRGLDWDYVSLAKPPKSIWDRFEIRVFGYNGRLPFLFYGLILIITRTIFIFI
jgi:hypothetical protein